MTVLRGDFQLFPRALLSSVGRQLLFLVGDTITSSIGPNHKVSASITGYEIPYFSFLIFGSKTASSNRDFVSLSELL